MRKTGAANISCLTIDPLQRMPFPLLQKHTNHNASLYDAQKNERKNNENSGKITVFT